MISNFRWPFIAIAIGVMFSLFISSCLDEIDLPVPSGLSDNVVIQGRIVLGEETRVEVQVGRLFDFSAESRENINVREVILIDESGTEMELEALNPGIYNTPLDASTPIKAEVNSKYKLQVSTFDNRTYESSFDLLNEGTPPASLDMSLVKAFETNPNGDEVPVDRLQLKVNTTINDNSSGLYWEVENTYKITDSPVEAGIQMKVCYITGAADATRLPMVNKANLSNAELDNFPLIIQPIDFRMAEGMYFTVRQYSLSVESAEYWENVSFLVEREGGLFEDPVGLLKSNFTNVNDPAESVYGYFYATQEDLIRIKVSEDLVGEMTPFCPPPPRPSPGPGCNLGICCDCLIDEGSTLLRPGYWID